MFDSINYKYFAPLETTEDIKKLNIDVEGFTFQTKDLDNCLETYIINEKGRLIHKKVKYKWVDDDNAFLKGYMDEESHELVDTNYHGDILFYAFEYIDVDDKEFSVDVDYKARFTNGNLEFINLEKSSVKETTGRKEEQEKYFNSFKKQKQKWYNRCIFNTRSYNNYFRLPVTRFFYSLSRVFQRLHYFISRHI